MKTTLDIDDHLLVQAKTRAAQERTTLTRMVEEGLRLRLRPLSKAFTGKLPPLPVSDKKGGLLPGIDSRSNRSMLDALDEFDANRK